VTPSDEGEPQVSQHVTRTGHAASAGRNGTASAHGTADSESTATSPTLAAAPPSSSSSPASPPSDPAPTSAGAAPKRGSGGRRPRQPAAGVQLELHLESFDGPLELLLLLIEQRRLPITRVSLAQVADQYLAQVHAQPSLDPDLLADFLVIGGKLLLLKSRALLLTEEADPEVEEVASDLAERLATYRVFRAAAERLRELEQRGERMYPTLREPLVSITPAELAPLGPKDLLAVWRRFLGEPRAIQVELPAIVRASVDAKRARILDALRSEPTVSFRAMAGDSIDEVIATFLAILELFRRAMISVAQPEPFGDLVLSPP
jgi:segregation and condensation protein A